MEELTKLMSELVELQKASIRLQKQSIVVAAENAAYLNALATATMDKTDVEKLVLKAVKEMRGAVDKIEEGKGRQK
jgi:hypothetical protein